MPFKDLCESEDGFTFYWKIKHFSLCSLSEDFRLESAVFKVEEIDNTGWNLLISTWPTEDADTDFLLEIFREDDGEDETFVDIGLFLLKTNGEKVIGGARCLSTMEINKMYVQASESSAILELKVSEIFENETLYLLDDTLTLGCFIKKHSGNMSVFSEYTSHTEMSTEIFSLASFFNIPFSGFQQHNMETISKTPKSKMYPKFKIILDSNVFHRNAEIKIQMTKSDFDVFSKCKLFVQNTEKEIVFLFEGKHKYLANRDNQSWKLTNSITSTAERSDALIGSNYILRCTLFASDGTYSMHNENLVYPCLASQQSTKQSKQSEAKQRQSETKQSNFLNKPTELLLKDKLKRLFDDSRLCDFTLEVDGKDFQIHKAVLGAVSPVFCSMFELEMKEKQKSVAIIKDIDANIMQKLIDFAYTESVEILQWENAIKLYSAANRYLILELKNCCTNWIINNLTIDNVTEVLTISDIYQDDNLEKAAVDYVFAHGKEVIRSENWKTFVASNVIVGNKVMQELCLKFFL